MTQTHAKHATNWCHVKTSRDRPKSAPNLRLKMTSKCQSFGELGPFYKKNEKKSNNAENNGKGGPFGIFQHPFCRKTRKKLKGGPLVEKKISKKSRTMPKTTKREDPLGFFKIHFVA